MNADPTVFVVDDDEAVRKSLQRLIESGGLRVEAYTCAMEFLDAYDPAKPGCLILDIRMPGMSGLELQQKLVSQGILIPIIIISGHGDIPKAVQAMKHGALDFIEKPFNDELLLDRISRAIELDAQIRQDSARQDDIALLIARLTPREREVMDLLVTGMSNKQVAAQLGISPKTVDIHRGHLMHKLEVDSLAKLVRIAVAHKGERAKP